MSECQSVRVSKNVKKSILFVIVAASLIVVADQCSKYVVSKNIAINHSVPVIKNIFYITFVKNQGIAFGIFQKGNPFFTLLAAVFIIVLLIFSKRFIEYLYSRIGLTLTLAGAVSNLIDRIFRGHIIDFLDFRIWPVFNLSDVALCVGVIFLCIQFCLK